MQGNHSGFVDSRLCVTTLQQWVHELIVGRLTSAMVPLIIRIRNIPLFPFSIIIVAVEKSFHLLPGPPQWQANFQIARCLLD